jgi:hypothetical protein
LIFLVLLAFLQLLGELTEPGAGKDTGQEEFLCTADLETEMGEEGEVGVDGEGRKADHLVVGGGGSSGSGQYHLDAQTSASIAGSSGGEVGSAMNTEGGGEGKEASGGGGGYGSYDSDGDGDRRDGESMCQGHGFDSKACSKVSGGNSRRRRKKEGEGEDEDEEEDKETTTSTSKTVSH